MYVSIPLLFNETNTIASIIYLFSDSSSPCHRRSSHCHRRSSHCHRRSRYVIIFVCFLYIVTKPLFNLHVLFVVVTLSDETVEKLASAINRGGRKKTHLVSASGSTTGIDTPTQVNGMIPVGDRNVPVAQFNEAKRYFDLFAEALADKYPDGGYKIMYNSTTGMCTMLGRKASDQYRFQFDETEVKNHYCSFRLLDNNFDNYLQTARPETGTQDYTGMRLITPPSTGAVSVSYRK
jgi:hypothetical protein